MTPTQPRERRIHNNHTLAVFWWPAQVCIAVFAVSIILLSLGFYPGAMRTLSSLAVLSGVIVGAYHRRVRLPKMVGPRPARRDQHGIPVNIGIAVGLVAAVAYIVVFVLMH